MFKPSPPVEFLKSLLDKSSIVPNTSEQMSPKSIDFIENFQEKANISSKIKNQDENLKFSAIANL